MVNVLKFQTVVACHESLEKEGRPRSDCSSLFAILTSIFRVPGLITNILFENRKTKAFEISEHLP